jgi:M6 family metalloprotease-like protein
MLQHTIHHGEDLVPDSLSFSAARNAVWAVTVDGRIVAVRLFDEHVGQVGSGYADPVGVVPLADGLRLAVAEAAGSIVLVRRDAADRADALLVADAPGAALGIRAHVEPTMLLILTDGSLDGGPSPQLLSCDVGSGTLTVVAEGLEGARTFVVDDDARTAIVLAALPDDSRTLTVINLDDGTTTTESDLPYQHIATAPPSVGAGVLVTRPDQASPGQDVLVHWDAGETTVEPLAGEVDGITRWGSMVLIASGQDLVAVDWGIDEGALPIAAPLGPLYVSGYARLVADLPNAGLSVGDIEYSVREGIDGGSISAGLQPPDPSGSESVMLLAGVRTGEFHLDAIRKADGELLTTRRFRVTTLWPDDVFGPPVAVTGNHQNMLMSWGGSGGTQGYLLPTPNEWRVLVVMVYLDDRGWDGTEDTARGQWKDRVLADPESLRAYYEEVSAFKPGAHGMTVDLVGDQVFGPAKVNAGWGDVFKQKTPGNVNAGWTTKPTGYGSLAGAVSDFFADLPNGASFMALADSIVIVVRSGSDEPTDMGPTAPKLPTRYVWGHARKDVDFYRKTTTTYTQFARPVTVMTDVYPAGAPARNSTYTLCHEIGHNLGLADLYDANNDYPAEINDRQAGAVDIMGSSQDLPHFSIANRIRLGWADRAWLRRFDFSASPTGGSVVLQATETLTSAGPPAGRSAGIEVPITDDWSYLFEYRREQPGQIGDQRMETSIINGRTEILVGTDLRVRGGEVARPPIIRLGKDADNDGPLLVNNGQDYTDSDVTNPQRMHDFVLRLNAIANPDQDSAEIDVDYLDAHRPQLQVRPAPGRGNFKSPDIDLIGPFGTSVPGAIKGATNAIKITVHNVGSLMAADTQIHVRWLPFTLTAGTWNNLDDPAPFDVPANGITSLVVPWAIPASVKVGDVEAEHFCVRVDIDRYRDPAHPEHEEIVVFDNWAQSNFDSKPVKFNSPSDRIATVTTATNVLDRTATYLFDAEQTTPWYRVFLGHAWLRLKPGQTQPIELAYECLAGDPLHGDEFDKNIESITSRDHQVAVMSAVMPEGTECDTPRDLFGVGLTLRAGRRVRIDQIGRDQEVVFARVHQVSGAATSPINFGQLHLAVWPDDEPERITRTRGRISNGFGSAPITGQTLQDLEDGRPTSFMLARPGDNVFGTTTTDPAPLQ